MESGVEVFIVALPPWSDASLWCSRLGAHALYVIRMCFLERRMGLFKSQYPGKVERWGIVCHTRKVSGRTLSF